MKRFCGLFVLMILGLLLAACGEQQPDTGSVPVGASGISTPSATAASTFATPSTSPAACSANSIAQPTPDPVLLELFPLPTNTDWSRGPVTATVTFLEYSDFQCPYCAQLEPILDQLYQAYPNNVRVVFRHFPLPIHKNARLAAQAVEAAGQQGKFFEMSSAVFAGQSVWSAMMPDPTKAWLLQTAKGLGLDEKKFTTDLASDEIAKKIEDAFQAGMKSKISGTPLLLINSVPYNGPRDLNSLGTIVKLYKLTEMQYAECPPMQIDTNKKYMATLETTQDNIVIELYPDKAPMTVNSFVFLARKGWFNGNIFHRVIPGFVAQTGDPSGTGAGGPGYYFDNEINSLRFDKAGVVGMANSGPNSNGSQFFITYSPQDQLDGKYTVFGQVVEGLSAAQKLQARDPSKGSDLPEGDRITRLTIEER